MDYSPGLRGLRPSFDRPLMAGDVASLPSRSPVYIVWDAERAAISQDIPPELVVRRINTFAEQYGVVCSIHCIVPSNSLLALRKQNLLDTGVIVRETTATHVETVTQLLGLVCMVAPVIGAQPAPTSTAPARRHSSGDVPGRIAGSAFEFGFGSIIDRLYDKPDIQTQTNLTDTGPSLIVITGGRALSTALALVSRSRLFSNVVLLHEQGDNTLLSTATHSLPWGTFLAGLTAPPAQIPFLPVPVEETHPQNAVVAESGLERHPSEALREMDRTLEIRANQNDFDRWARTKFASTPTQIEDPISALNLEDDESEPFENSGAVHDTIFDIPTSLDITEPEVPAVPVLTLQQLQQLQQEQPTPQQPTPQPTPQQPTPQQPTPQQPTPQQLTTQQSPQSWQQPHFLLTPPTSPQRKPLPALPMDYARVAAMRPNGFSPRDALESTVKLYHEVVAYCKQEMIIPRESVLRRRLEHNLSLRNQAANSPKFGASKAQPQESINFEEFVTRAAASGVCIIEGTAPQRILWPKEGRYPCADFFRPTERLTAEQTQILMQFLERRKPVVDQGRFGMTLYLKQNGPEFLRQWPLGYIVELVQLLLNTNVLSFRKGKISFKLRVDPTFKADQENPTDFDEDESILQEGTVGLSSNDYVETLAVLCAHAMGGALGLKRRSVPVLQRTFGNFRKPSRGWWPMEDVADDLTAPCPIRGTIVGGRFITLNSDVESSWFAPTYHFERAGEAHEPEWVAVVTLPVARGRGLTATLQQSQLKQFKSGTHVKKQDAKEEAAQRAIEGAQWALVWSACMVELLCVFGVISVVREPLDEKTELEESRSESPLAAYLQTRRKETDYSQGRKMLNSAMLALVNPNVDAVTTLDRLLAALQQPPITYFLRPALTSAGAKTKWACSVEVELRATLKSPDAGAPGGTHTIRYPIIRASASRARKSEAKALVAIHVLTVLSRNQERYAEIFPGLHSISLPSSPYTSPACTPPFSSGFLTPRSPSTESGGFSLSSSPIPMTLGSRGVSPRDSPLVSPRVSPTLTPSARWLSPSC
jgi:hypothetical protein